MAEQVGAIYFDVTFETRQLLDGQKKIDQSLQQTSGRMDAFQGKVTAVASAVGVLGAALAAVRVAKMADELRLLEVRVQVAAGGLKEGAAAMLELEAISKRTQTSIAANAEVFTRLNSAMKAMGGTQAQTLALTETLAQAIKVSGASAVEAKAAMLQFGQALGSGKLAGDELRSLMESAPYLMKQMADAIGVPVGSLKKLGEEGKLTADVVANAMLKASKKIQEDFAKFPQTFGDAVTALENAALRANKALDGVTGSSVALAGITKGLADTVDELTRQVTGLSDESTTLARNLAIVEWSKESRVAFSYLVDAADMLWQTLSVLGRNVSFVFKGILSEVKGIGSQAAAVARGDFEGARAIGEQMKADAAQRRAELDAADKATLSRTQTMGAKMREAWDRGAGGGRGFINPSAPGAAVSLKAPAGTGGGDAKRAGAKFDEAGYLSDLRKVQASEINAINETEAEKLRVAKKYLDERKISEKAYTEAVSLITQDAEQARVELMRKTQSEIDKQRQDDEEKTRQAWERKKAGEKAVADYVFNLTRAVDPLSALEQEYKGKLALVTQYEQLMAQAGVSAEEQAQLARTEITRTYEAQRLALAEQTFASQSASNQFLMESINALGQTATSSIVGLIQGTTTAADVMRNLGRVILQEAVGAVVQFGIAQVKNAVLEKTLAASKGAMYTASVSAQVAGMSALAAQNAFAATAAIPIVGPALAPGAALAAASAASALGAPAIATAPVAGARQYGGPVSAGSLYRVNETGKSEMFVGANGSQYMIPNQSGKVVSADNVAGGGQPWTIIINEAAPGTTATVDERSRVIEFAAAAAEARVVGQIRENSGPVWSALRSSTNVQGRL